jgi:hypothetical protein
VIATYHPAKTEHRQAATRCGLRLKRSGLGPGLLVVLLDDSTGAVVFTGSREDSWDFMRTARGLHRGEH